MEPTNQTTTDGGHRDLQQEIGAGIAAAISAVEGIPSDDVPGPWGEYLEKTVRRITTLCIGQNRKWITDVIVPSGEAEFRIFLDWFVSSVPASTGSIFGWCRHEDHLHDFHDCSFSNGSCRWRKHACLSSRLRRKLRRRPPFAINLSRRDWQNTLLYFFFQEGVQEQKLYLRREEFPTPGSDYPIRRIRVHFICILSIKLEVCRQ